MFLTGVINAKVHLVSGLIVGGLLVAATMQMRRNCQWSEKRCNSIQPTSSNNDGLSS